ncbi:MAG: hypothetical protein ACRDZ2_08590 [Ilumatobacteraceae bacterium]
MGPLSGGGALSFRDGGGHGPPATEKQLAYLQSLLRKEGYDGFRDARRPLGLTQRQGTGKFTRSEASALIDRLAGGDDTPDQASLPIADSPPEAPSRDADLRHQPAEALAAELARRGWSVTPPPPASGASSSW